MRFMQKIFTICTINDVSVGTHVNTQKNPAATCGSRIEWGN